MTDPQWRFKPKQPDDTTRDPISGEFFATEAIRNSAEALVREGIQNSLDAHEAKVVRVRIALSHAASSDVHPFVGGLAPHLAAKGNGLRESQRPDLTESCRFLVFEDFGTKGLVGDPLQWHRDESRTNGFFAFFRAEGESDKAESDRRGRWGVGKFVFPRASMGSTFFGVTYRRGDPAPLLLGRSILKSHRIGTTYHVPDGYFGVQRSTDAGPIMGPVGDPSVVDRFARVFGLQRGREPGLSIVVPWHDPEITIDRLVEAAVRDWFYSIANGELELTITDGSRVVGITRESLRAVLQLVSDEIRRDVLPLLDLVDHAMSTNSPVTTAPPDVSTAPKWPDNSPILPSDAIVDLRTSLNNEEPIHLRIPIEVRPKGKPKQDSRFDIYVKRDATSDDGRPTFIREGIIVSDAKGTRARGFRSIVVADDAPLADLLGDAENPSHTEWRPDTANFKDKYYYGPGYLNFVKSAAARLIELLQETEDDSAPDLLISFFSLPTEVGHERPLTKPTPRPGQKPTRPDNLPPPKPPRYRINRFEDGFVLTHGADSVSPPAEIDISVAYDVRRGNPFSKYHPADFQLQKGTVKAAVKGLAVESIGPNYLKLRVTEPKFLVRVCGFDKNRELIVKATARGNLHDDAPNQLD